jgi:hypothetical protein
MMDVSLILTATVIESNPDKATNLISFCSQDPPITHGLCSIIILSPSAFRQSNPMPGFFEISSKIFDGMMPQRVVSRTFWSTESDYWSCLFSRKNLHQVGALNEDIELDIFQN